MVPVNGGVGSFLTNHTLLWGVFFIALLLFASFEANAVQKCNRFGYCYGQKMTGWNKLGCWKGTISRRPNGGRAIRIRRALTREDG